MTPEAGVSRDISGSRSVDLSCDHGGEFVAAIRNNPKLELEVAQQMANHESARTTGLYHRRGDDVSRDERIGI